MCKAVHKQCTMRTVNVRKWEGRYCNDVYASQLEGECKRLMIIDITCGSSEAFKALYTCTKAAVWIAGRKNEN